MSEINTTPNFLLDIIRLHELLGSAITRYRDDLARQDEAFGELGDECRFCGEEAVAWPLLGPLCYHHNKVQADDGLHPAEVPQTRSTRNLSSAQIIERAEAFVAKTVPPEAEAIRCQVIGCEEAAWMRTADGPICRLHLAEQAVASPAPVLYSNAHLQQNQQVGMTAALDQDADSLTVAGRKRLELARALAPQTAPGTYGWRDDNPLRPERRGIDCGRRARVAALDIETRGKWRSSDPGRAA